MKQISGNRGLTLLSLLLCLAVPSLRASFVETFEDGTNDGDWTQRLLISLATMQSGTSKD